MINESSLSTVEIGLDSDFKAFYIRQEKRGLLFVFFFFFDKLVLFYHELVILRPYFRP
jgi:hypothetical protein